MLAKLKYEAINNKKIIFFLFTLCLIGIISSSILVTVISKSDKESIINYIKEYKNTFNNIDFKTILTNSLLNNIIPTLFVWLIGISIIGVPIILFVYFYKMFILGFTISSFILSYKFKGLMLTIIYIFPSKIITILVITLICLYAIKISSNLIYTFLSKKETNNNRITKKYIKILFISIIILLLNTLYEGIILPVIMEKAISFLKI